MSTLDRRALSWLRAHRATISGTELDEDDITIDRRKALVRSGTIERVLDGA